MLEEAIAAVFILFYLAGAFSIGYLVLRFVYPEIRTFDSKKKLVTVIVVSLAIAFTAFLLDFGISGQRAFKLDSFAMPLLFIVMLFYFLVMRVFFLFGATSRKFVTVGIPIAPIPTAVHVAASSASGKAQKVTLKASKVALAEIKKVEDKEVKKNEARKERLMTSIGETQTYVEKVQQRVVEIKKAETKKVEVKKIETRKVDAKKPETKKVEAKSAKVEKPNVAPVEIAPIVIEKPREVKDEAQLEHLKRQTIEKPVEVKFQITSQPPVAIASPSTLFPPSVLEVNPVVSSEVVTKPAVGKAAIASQLKPSIDKKSLEVKPVPVAAVPKKQGSSGGGFFGFLFGGNKKQTPVKVAVVPAKVGVVVPTKKVVAVPAKVNPNEPPSFATWRGIKEAERKKLEAQRKALETKKKEESEIQELVSSVTKEDQIKAQTTSGPVHRRYLLSDEVNVIANKDVAQTEEFGLMVQDVYSQIKTPAVKPSDVVNVNAPKVPVATAVASVAHVRTAASVASAAAAQQTKPEVGLSVSDILGNDLFASSPAPKQESASSTGGNDLFANTSAAMSSASVSSSESSSGGNDIFARLSQATESPVRAAPESQRSDVSFVQMQADKTTGCPTCHSKTGRIIFCPYCGTGMCANCSPSIKPLENSFVYTCPKCSEDVNVKKKAG
ncbi:MAG: hypothetical protein V1722_00390 [Candidatus Micrarchaeota archaeon]